MHNGVGAVGQALLLCRRDRLCVVAACLRVQREARLATSGVWWHWGAGSMRRTAGEGTARSAADPATTNMAIKRFADQRSTRDTAVHADAGRTVPAGLWRTMMTCHWPESASDLAAARPRPEEAPVMITVGFCCAFGWSAGHEGCRHSSAAISITPCCRRLSPTHSLNRQHSETGTRQIRT